MSDLVSQAAAALRASGGRMTSQRRVILKALDSLDGHPTAEQVYNAACQHDVSINLSTVYRTLDWLEAAGLVNHRHLDTGPRGERCERFDPATQAEHYHFVCTKCGEVIEFDSPWVEQVKEQFVRQQGASVEQASLTLHGLCHSCLSRRPIADEQLLSGS